MLQYQPGKSSGSWGRKCWKLISFPSIPSLCVYNPLCLQRNWLWRSSSVFLISPFQLIRNDNPTHMLLAASKITRVWVAQVSALSRNRISHSGATTSVQINSLHLSENWSTALVRFKSVNQNQSYNLNFFFNIGFACTRFISGGRTM